MTRPSDMTRRSLLDAATRIFAERGFSDASIRAITRRAKANQAAVTYHFGGKDGLYRAVLILAFETFDDLFKFDSTDLETVDRDVAVRTFLTRQLEPLLRRSDFNNYLRIFAWESVKRSPVFDAYVASEPIPIFRAAVAIAGRYLPASASQEQVLLVGIWFVQQASIFIRDFDRLSKPPLNLALDADFTERLAALVCQLVLGALNGLAASPPVPLPPRVQQAR
jgi:AcrR family transcriptional regulator